MLEEVLLIAGLSGLIWYWWDTQRSNETAIQSARALCRSSGYQLLDMTVSRQRTWLRRHSGGVQICRLYSFEYSRGGGAEYGFGDRRFGYLVLLGRQVVETRISDFDRVESEASSTTDSTLH